MADVEEPHDSRFDDIDLESILARVERRGPLTFTRKRCLYRAPEFVKKLPTEETVEEGSTVKFECKAVGFPKPNVNWTKDLDVIPDNPRITFQHGELGEASIEIQKIKKSDEGSYRCKAENAEGSSSSSIYITIKVKPKSPKRSQQRVITFTSAFTTITERIDEEEKEAEEFMRQPMSPLTYLYDGVTIKEKSWPDFLGNWAFLTSDLEGMDENMDASEDEEVFLPPLPTEKFVSDNNFHSDVENTFDNDLDNDTIPNLIFENKNLVNSNKDVNLNYSSNVCDRLIKDENANDHLSKTRNDNKTSDMENSTNQNDNRKHCDVNRLDNSVNGKIKHGDHEDGVFIKPDVDKRKKKFDEKICSRNSMAIKLNDKSSSQKRPLMSNTATVYKQSLEKVSVAKEREKRVYILSFNLMMFVFVISGLTLLALTADVAPLDFVFTIFIGQVIYAILKFLCTDV